MISINELLKNPENYIQKINLEEIIEFIKKANYNYFETDNQLIPDSIYDLLIDRVKELDSNNDILTRVGNDTNDKVKLPFYMGSMNKYKDRHSIENWFKKHDGNFVVSDKLDGSSALLQLKNGIFKMWSRGNGVEGRDISHLLKYMKIPKLNEDITLRGELIISKQNFEKYKSKYSNNRSMVNGLMGHNNPDPILIENLDYVVFEIIEKEIPKKSFSYQDFLGDIYFLNNENDSSRLKIDPIKIVEFPSATHSLTGRFFFSADLKSDFFSDIR